MFWSVQAGIQADKDRVDIVRVVETSAAVNHAQLIGTQDGKVLVPT